MIYVKLNETLYPAIVNGRVSNKDWDNRESKAITLEGDYTEVDALFTDGVKWSIVEETSVVAVDENGKKILDDSGNNTYTIQQTEYDNSEFSVRGDLTVHTDGTCTIVMGKPTELETAYELLYGGIE